MKKAILLLGLFCIFPKSAIAASGSWATSPSDVFAGTVTANGYVIKNGGGVQFPDSTIQYTAAVSIATGDYLNISNSTQSKAGGIIAASIQASSATFTNNITASSVTVSNSLLLKDIPDNSGIIATDIYHGNLPFLKTAQSDGRNGIYLGFGAGQKMDPSAASIAIGHNALYNGAGNAYGNTVLGENALQLLINGGYNVAIGEAASSGVVNANHNIALGYQATWSDSLSNATAIGDSASVACSNCIALGNASVIGVGIGTDAPSSKFDVNNGSISVRGTNAGISINGVPIGTASAISLPLPSGATNYIQNSSSLQSGATFFVSSGTAQILNGNSLQISSGVSLGVAGGLVGINTVVPIAKLNIVGGDRNSGLRLQDDSTFPSGLTFDNLRLSGGILYSLFQARASDSPGAGALAFRDETNSKYRMVIFPSGNVGVGTTDVRTKFEVYNNTDSFITGQDSFRISATVSVSTPGSGPLMSFASQENKVLGMLGSQLENNQSTTSAMTFYTVYQTTLTEKVRIAGNGNFGVGTSTVSSLVDILGGSITIRGTGANLSVAGISFLTWTSTTASQLGSLNTSTGAIFSALQTTAAAASLQYNSIALATATANTDISTTGVALQNLQAAVSITTGANYSASQSSAARNSQQFSAAFSSISTLATAISTTGTELKNYETSVSISTGILTLTASNTNYIDTSGSVQTKTGSLGVSSIYFSGFSYIRADANENTIYGKGIGSISGSRNKIFCNNCATGGGSGSSNILIGDDALNGVGMNGDANVYTGYFLAMPSTATNCVVSGQSAGNLRLGTNDVILGANTNILFSVDGPVGNSNNHMSKSTIIGDSAGGTNYAHDLAYAAAFGADARVGASYTQTFASDNTGLTKVVVGSDTATSRLDVFGGSITVRGNNAGIESPNLRTSSTTILAYGGGLVGIGTIAPSSLLDVNGGSVTVRGANAGVRISTYFNASPDGNLAVSTTNANGYKLFVNGDDRSNSVGIYSNTATRQPGVYYEAEPTGYKWNTFIHGSLGGFALYEETGGSAGTGYRVFIASGGNVGIGTTSTAYKLRVEGSLFVNNSLTDKISNILWTNPSDSRLKDIVGNFDDSLDKIAQIQPIQYRFKADNPFGADTNEIHTGVIAQDVQQVFPEAVTVGTDGYLRFTGDRVFWAAINSIKELKKKNEDLKSLICGNALFSQSPVCR